MIEVRNLGFKYFNSRKVLSNISFSINSGEFVLIIGPSASGKTTLAYCISGIIPHVIDGEIEGEVFFKGIKISELDFSEISRDIGVVLQNPEAQIFGMTVEEDIAFGLENLGFKEDVIERKIDYWLKMFDLVKYKNYNPRFLSGGQKQKLVIASVLAMEPNVLILDEPFINLDQKGKYTLLKIILDFKNKGKSIVLIDKKVTGIIKFVDKVIVLSNDGRLLSVLESEKFLSSRERFEKLGIFPPQNSLHKTIII